MCVHTKHACPIWVFKAHISQRIKMLRFINEKNNCVREITVDIECLCHERDYLKGILLKARKDIDGAPEGTLRITRSKRNPVYYYRKNLSDRSGEYIKASNRDLAKKLAHKDYAEDID